MARFRPAARVDVDAPGAGGLPADQLAGTAGDLDATTSGEVVKGRSGLGPVLALALVAAVVAAGLLARRGGGSEPVAAPSTTVAAPTSTPTSVAAAPGGSTSGAGNDANSSSGGADAAGAGATATEPGRARAIGQPMLADLRGLADLDLAVSAVVTSSQGIDPRLVAVNQSGDVLVAPLPESTRFTFDQSGRWLAGVSQNEGEAGTAVLWAGPVGGIFEPVAVGVDGFAWHESRAGLLGWSASSADNRQLVSWRFAEGEVHQWDLPVTGQLQGWGEWGFAVATDAVDPETVFLDPDARLVDEPQPGRYGGYLPGHGILLTGGRPPPDGSEADVVFDPWSRGLVTVPWLEADDAVWRTRASPDEGGALVVVARDPGSGSSRGEIVLVRGDRSATVVAETVGVGEVAWSPDTTRLVFAEQGRRSLLALEPDGGWIEVALPDLFDGVELVAALSVR